MSKKILTIMCMTAMICTMFTGCDSKKQVESETGSTIASEIGSTSVTTLDNTDIAEESTDIESIASEIGSTSVTTLDNTDIAEESTDIESDEDVKTETESICGVNYSITGKLHSHALFEGGPHDYSFDRFSVNIDSSYNPDLDFADAEAVAAFAEEYSKEKEINNFVVSDLKTEQVSIEALNRSGAIVSFNAINDTDMTVYYKMLVFRADEDFIITSEFSSFYDDREEVVDAELDKFMLTLSE